MKIFIQLNTIFLTSGKSWLNAISVLRSNVFLQIIYLVLSFNKIPPKHILSSASYLILIESSWSLLISSNDIFDKSGNIRSLK